MRKDGMDLILSIAAHLKIFTLFSKKKNISSLKNKKLLKSSMVLPSQLFPPRFLFSSS